MGLTKTKRSGVFKSMSKGVTSMLRSAGREGHEVRPGRGEGVRGADREEGRGRRVRGAATEGR